MSEALRKICLQHQALYEAYHQALLFHKEPDDVNIFYEKLSSF